ncbi:MAG: hypothetical protein ACRD15_12400 [Vicinamibacterales bacterium]
MLRFLAAALMLMPLSSGGIVQSRAEEQAASERVTLGVLRSDGILLPFAAFDGDDWSMPWPAGIGGDLPVNLAAVPEDWWGDEVPRQWRLWPRGSEEGSSFKLLSPVMAMVGAQRRLGLRTDHTGAANLFIPPFELPYPKEGLAVGGGVRVQPIASVSRLAPAMKTFVDRLRADIDDAEERAIKALRANARWTHPFDDAARSKVVPDFEAWYTSSLVEPGFSVSYVEAVKKYPPQPRDEGCGLETFITGWVHGDEREPRLKTQLKALVTYCDREHASYMLPLGQMRLRNRTHWIYQMSGRDHEWYAVAELTPGRTRIPAEYYAGGAPSSEPQ